MTERASQGAPPLAGAGCRSVGLAGPLALAIRVSLHDELIGVVGEAVERALGQDRIVEERDPLVDRPVAGHDRGSAAVPLEDHLVDVARLLSGEPPQGEVVDDEEVRR